MDHDAAHALAARIQQELSHATGQDCRQRVGVYREDRPGPATYTVHVYAPPRPAWVLHRPCHWWRRN
jgi:hypothetical protein